MIKQADVVALLGLLPDEFAADTGRANFHYYEPRCGHGSSLSRAMHGFVAARLGYSEMALRYFQQTAAIDLADTPMWPLTAASTSQALGGVLADGGVGFRGTVIERRRRGHRPTTADELEQPWLRPSVAWPTPHNQD